MVKLATLSIVLGVAILVVPMTTAHAEFHIRTLHRSAPSYHCVWQEGGRSGSCQFTSPAKVGSRCDCVAGKTLHHGIVSKFH